MNIHEIEHPLAAIFQVEGRLDAAATPELEKKVTASLDHGRRILIMDCSHLHYINSAGLRILVMSYQRLNPLGGRVVVCGARDYIAEIFDISGYNRIFDMHPDLDHALRAVKPLLTAPPSGQ